MRSRPAFATASVTILATLLVAALCLPTSAAKVDPRKTGKLYVDPYSSAMHRGAPFGALASVPQARWLTEHDPVGAVGRTVASYVGSAAKASRIPQLVLYGIPLRDCGSFSAGGWSTPAEYQAWVNAIIKGLGSARALVILEPDALAASETCGGAARLNLLRWAAKRLSTTKAWTYLDAGHSGWQPVDAIAPRLAAAGVKWTRGISLNVSNYRATATEKRYGTAIVAALAKRKIRGRHVVIDTSRNGVKPVSGQWCNPTWARVGAKPHMVRKKGPIDGYLWVKHPGESDGTCNGGPTAGLWSDLLANRLLGRTTA